MQYQEPYVVSRYLLDDKQPDGLSLIYQSTGMSLLFILIYI